MKVRNEDGMNWKQFSTQSILALTEWIGGDGHSVIGYGNMSDRKIRELGFTPKEWMIFGSKAELFKSNLKNPKGTIFDKEGNPINVRGWHTLTLQWEIARDIGANTEQASSKHGRGSQAGELHYAIQARLLEITGMVTNENGDVTHTAVILPIETILGKEVTA